MLKEQLVFARTDRRNPVARSGKDGRTKPGNIIKINILPQSKLATGNKNPMATALGGPDVTSQGNA
mgnify:CR=1 FL=1